MLSSALIKKPESSKRRKNSRLKKVNLHLFLIAGKLFCSQKKEAPKMSKLSHENASDFYIMIVKTNEIR